MKKRKRAAALKYEAERDNAPKVVAKGKGLIAEKIIELAQKSQVPIYEDQALANLLTELDLGQEIPPALYPIIAEILAFIYKLNNTYR